MEITHKMYLLAKEIVNEYEGKKPPLERPKSMNTKLLSDININDLKDDDIEPFQIALAFRNLFIANLQELNAPTVHQENANYKNYVLPIKTMLTKENVTKDQFTKVFKYLQSKEGDFWKPNILSTKKLREKFSQLLLKSQQNANRNNTFTNTNSASAKGTFNLIDAMFGNQ